jgi:hypothetical protein
MSSETDVTVVHHASVGGVSLLNPDPRILCLDIANELATCQGLSRPRHLPNTFPKSLRHCPRMARNHNHRDGTLALLNCTQPTPEFIVHDRIRNSPVSTLPGFDIRWQKQLIRAIPEDSP